MVNYNYFTIHKNTNFKKINNRFLAKFNTTIADIISEAITNFFL